MEVTTLLLLAAATVSSSTAAASDQAECDRIVAVEPRLSLNVTSPGMLQDEPAEAPASYGTGLFSQEPAPAFGAKGSMRFNIQGGYGHLPADDEESFALGGVSVSYFIIDHLSIDLELNGLHVWQDGDNAAGINLNVMLRHHIFHGDNWTIYLDGGAGIMFSNEEIPQGASEFNFTPQAGAGFTYDIGSGNRLFGGIRWYHISNANTEDYNPGLDFVYFYAGLSLPF